MECGQKRTGFMYKDGPLYFTYSQKGYREYLIPVMRFIDGEKIHIENNKKVLKVLKGFKLL